MVAASAHTAVKVAAAALAAAGGDDRAAIRDAISRTEVVASTGTISFNSLGEVRKDVQVQIVRDGNWRHHSVISDPCCWHRRSSVPAREDAGARFLDPAWRRARCASPRGPRRRTPSDRLALTMLVFELFVQGLVQGSIYALIAVGLTLVYGLLRILHVAHAGLFTLGGYCGVLITNETGSLALALPVSMLLVGIVGMGMYKLCYEPILRHPPFVALIASIGLFIAMEELYRLVFGPYGISFAEPPLPASVDLLGMHLKLAEVMTMLGAGVLIGALALLSARTRIGVAWRATVTMPEIAESFGIDIERVRYLNFFIGSALAAVPPVVLVAVLNNFVEPTMGSVPSYKALAIIVLGGLGDVRGTLIAALALGVVEAYGTIYLGEVLDRDAIAFTFLIIVLMIRPQGLFGKALS